MGENVIVETETDFGERESPLFGSGKNIAESWERFLVPVVKSFLISIPYSIDFIDSMLDLGFN